MNLLLGTAVYDSDDTELGQLEGVLVDAPTKTVTHLVVQEGLLFEHAQFAPVSLVRSADAMSVVLDATAQELIDAFTDETDAGDGTHEKAPQLGTVSIMPPGYARVELDEALTTPGSQVLLACNAPVQTQDGVDVGRTQGLILEAGGRIAHVIVVKGIVAPELKLVSADTIAEFADNLVLLSLNADDADEFERWEELPESGTGSDSR